MLQFYAYQACSTCRKARQWLEEQGVAFQEVPIRETPPSVHELKSALDASGGNVRALFNVSGMDYRAMDLKDKLAHMDIDQALKLLSSNGNLVKRPFVIDLDRQIHLIGFKEPLWRQVLL